MRPLPQQRPARGEAAVGAVEAAGAEAVAVRAEAVSVVMEAEAVAVVAAAEIVEAKRAEPKKLEAQQ